MKLYTEEQVNLAMRLIHTAEQSYMEVLDSLIPIELPSDEEVEKCAEVLYPINKGGSMFMPSRDDINKANKQEGFLEGAKWMKEQILNQSKKNK
jgi:hypothetical protein